MFKNVKAKQISPKSKKRDEQKSCDKNVFYKLLDKAAKPIKHKKVKINQ